MKTVFFILSVLIVSPSWALADDLAIAETMSDATHVISAGVVKSVSWADPAKGTKSEIVVMNAARKPTNILVTATTTLWDADAKAIMQERIIPKNHVNVVFYTTPEGVNIAKSIKILS